MITNDADVDSLEGFWSKLKKVGKGVASVGKGAVKGVGKVGYQAGKLGVKAGTVGVKTGYTAGKFAVKQAARLPKALADLALYPVRKSLGTLKDRRAKTLAFTKRGVKTPTVAEKAQARKDVKSMLSKKGPHGKMLAYLAGGPMLTGELGVVGYDDAALAAVATTLLASLRSIMSSAAKGNFAPVDAAKAGLKAGASAGLTKMADTSTGQKAAAAYRAVAAYEAKPTPEAAPEAAEYVEAEETAPAVTPEEVAAEPAVEAEEAAVESETEAIEGALAGIGMLDGFMEAAPAAAAPSAMPEKTARRIALASQRILCQMSTPALMAIGGIHAPQIASALCQGIATGDDATVRAALPGAVQIAARVSADIASQAMAQGLPNDGFGGAASPDDLTEIGMLAAFDGADPDELSYGLAGVGLTELQAADSGSVLPVSLAALAAVAGLWLALR